MGDGWVSRQSLISGPLASESKMDASNWSLTSIFSEIRPHKMYCKIVTNLMEWKFNVQVGDFFTVASISRRRVGWSGAVFRISQKRGRGSKTEKT